MQTAQTENYSKTGDLQSDQKSGSVFNKGWLLAIAPLGLFGYFLRFLTPVSQGEVYRVAWQWVPSLGIEFSLYIDGLSLLFVLLVSGIGGLILIYGGAYLARYQEISRFYITILFFMASMVGLVLADNLITMFIFWELTSISSYLLIGFSHNKEKARTSALRALLVTGLGGVLLLAGLILLGSIGGSLEFSQLVSDGNLVREHDLYLPILLLILIGAFTKSAQVPFHFWLPGAMEAPTPVSAYLHSATMVKAGIYLIARLNPVLGGTDEWHYILTLIGAVTMLTGAILALPQTDLKRILAYTTVSALGTLTLLLGLSTTLATKAAMVFLVVHSLYKGALFMVAGSVDQAAGTRDINLLGGLRRFMPITATTAILAALSMAGLPPMLGFISKELLYEAKLQAPNAATIITIAGIAANVLMVALAAIVSVRIFWCKRMIKADEPVFETSMSMRLGPALLAGLSLLIGLFPDLFAEKIITPAVSAVRAQDTVIKLTLWHGINPIFALSLFTVLMGVIVFLLRNRIIRIASPLKRLTGLAPSTLYDKALSGLNILARIQTRVLQNGYLRYYLSTILLVSIVLAGWLLLPFPLDSIIPDKDDIRTHEALLVGLILLAALVAVRSVSRLASVTALGVVGFGVALIFLLFGAPDLAMTQFAIETLTVILLVLVLYRLPRFSHLANKTTRLRDAILAGSMGIVMTCLLLLSTAKPLHSPLASYFSQNSLSLAKGRNIVNVILVDFRVLDTLGEIIVLAVAAIGVFGLLKLKIVKGKSKDI